MWDPARRRSFILANTSEVRSTLCPALRLRAITRGDSFWHAGERELATLGLGLPFWAVAWAGGEALALHVERHPALVRGRRVLDVGTGGGLVALAAARAGAATVDACDVDPFAVTATELNAELNGLVVTARQHDPTGDPPGTWDVILGGDVCYDHESAARVRAWAHLHAGAGTTVLLSDANRGYLADAGLGTCTTYEVPADTAVEERAVVTARVWHLGP